MNQRAMVSAYIPLPSASIDTGQSVSDRRRAILTKDVLAITVPEMVQRGLRARDIAEKLGCKLNTLKVRCSQAGVSLRPPGARKSRAYHVIRLDRSIMNLLRDYAGTTGKSAAAVAMELLERIARDDLFDAVLDTDDYPAPKVVGEAGLEPAKA